MLERTWGSSDRTQLLVRVFIPFEFKRYGASGWRLRPLCLLNPRRWWRALRSPWNWRFRSRYMREVNHRCYCPTGASWDGNITVAGWGLSWWWSHYNGEIPCACERALEEMEAQRAGEMAAVPEALAAEMVGCIGRLVDGGPITEIDIRISEDADCWLARAIGGDDG